MVSFQKYSFSTHDRYYQKGAVPLAIQKGKVGDRIKFGKPMNARTDLCYPIYVVNDGHVPEGNYRPERVLKCGKPVYNYDCTFRTEDFQRGEFWRFSKAYHRYFKEWTFGSTKEKAFKTFIGMMKGRFNRSPYKNFTDHPKYIRDRIINIKEEELGYDGWGYFR